jgi:integrase
MLTAKRIEQLRKTPGRYRDDGEGGVQGLYLNVPPRKGKLADDDKPGGASWLFRYDIECEQRVTQEGNETNRRERWMGLGSLDDFSLKQARERAREKRRLLADGIDPLTAKKEAKLAKAMATSQTITFREASRLFLEQSEKKWTNAKHRAQWGKTLEDYAFPVVGDWPVSSIDIGAVLKVLEQRHKDYPDQRLWDAIPETAGRLRGRIESVMAWAKVRYGLKGDNPAGWALLKHSGLPSRNDAKSHPALPYADNDRRYPSATRGIASFVAALRNNEGVVARALEFMILTAARTGAVILATRDEFDLEEQVWTIPAGRAGSKTSVKDKPRLIPLSDRAVAILRGLPTVEGNPFMFIGTNAGGGIPEASMKKLMRKMAFASTTAGKLAVPYGCRSTFTDWVAEATDHGDAVADQALLHVVGDKVDRAYRRTDLFKKRIAAMEDWARHLGPVTTGAKVVNIRAAK